MTEDQIRILKTEIDTVEILFSERLIDRKRHLSDFSQMNSHFKNVIQRRKIASNDQYNISCSVVILSQVVISRLNVTLICVSSVSLDLENFI